MAIPGQLVVLPGQHVAVESIGSEVAMDPLRGAWANLRSETEVYTCHAATGNRSKEVEIIADKSLENKYEKTGWSNREANVTVHTAPSSAWT